VIKVTRKVDSEWLGQAPILARQSRRNKKQDLPPNSCYKTIIEHIVCCRNNSLLRIVFVCFYIFDYTSAAITTTKPSKYTKLNFIRNYFSVTAKVELPYIFINSTWVPGKKILVNFSIILMSPLLSGTYSSNAGSNLSSTMRFSFYR